MIARRNFISLCVIAVVLTLAATSQTKRSTSVASLHHSQVVSIRAHVDSWIRGYTKWSTSHPELLFNRKGKNQQSTEPDDSSLRIDLQWPFLACFKPNGDLIYVGMESGANGRFLSALPKSAHINLTPDVYPPQPPFGVYFDIFPDLRPYRASILSKNEPILLTICSASASACKEQNDATTELKKRLSTLHIQLIEVQIVPNGKQ